MKKLNFVDRIVVSFLALLSFNMLIGALSWIMKVPYNATIASIFYVIIGVFLLMMRWKQNAKVPPIEYKKSSNKNILSITGLMPLLLAMSVFFLIIIPLLAKNNTNYIYQFVTSSGDNLSHLELTNVTEKHQGFLYNEKSRIGDEVSESLVAYPQGMHLNISLLRDAVEPLVEVNSSIKRQLLFYVISTALFYSLLVYTVTRLMLLLSSRYGRVGQACAFFATASLFFGLFINMYLYGFQTQLLSLSFLIAQITIFILAQAYTSDIKRFAYYILALFMSVGVSFSWLFILPISLAGCAFVILSDMIASLTRKNINRPKIIRLLGFTVTYSALLAIILIQVYVQVRYGAKNDPINESGFTDPTNVFTVILLGLSMYIYALFRQLKRDAKVLLSFGIAASVFSLVIYIYQIINIGHADYYYYKSSYTIILLGAVTAVPLISYFISKLDVIKQRRTLQSILILAGIAVTVGCASPLTHIVLSGQVQGTTPGLANALGALLIQDTDNQNIVSIGSCNRAQDFLATRLANTVTGNNNVLQQGVAFAQLSNRKTVIEKMRYYKKNANKKFIIINNNPHQQNVLPSDILADSSIITVSDLPQERSPAACPNALTD